MLSKHVNISFYELLSKVKQGIVIIYNSFCHLTSPKFIPTWSDSQAVIDRILMLFLSFQSPHNGDDLSEGEGDVGSPDDEMAQKVRNILFVI